MQVRLTIQEKLKDLRVEKHLTLAELSERTGISSSALGKYESDDFKDISPFSIVTLAKFYSVSTDYLLGLTEQKNHPDTALEELHLSDTMIELLKSGKINNRLLCEIASHERFSRFMADMEIYVDGIAAMQIQSLNSVVDMARIEIEERYHPAEDDRYMQTLQAAHIDEDGYFSQLIHGDIDAIAKGLRVAHVKDSDTAPAESIGDELQKSLEAASEFKGSADEKKLKILCNQLGINYDGLSEDEFAVMIKVLSRSKKLKSAVSQRGKTSPYQKRGKGKRKK